MNAPKIPKLNEEFDPKLFRHILFRKLPLIVLIFAFALLGAYLMLRYTQPVYQSRTIIQIETESKAEKLLDIGRFSSEQFSQKIELLRSRVFLERVFAKLPLTVNYYNEGKFLRHELYTSSPFTVNYVVYNPVVYGIPFRLSYVSDSLYRVSYTIHNGQGEIKREAEMTLGKWCDFDEVDIVIHPKSNGNSSSLTLMQRNNYLFEIQNPDILYDLYVSNISLAVLNEAARTIQILVRDRHAGRATDIANEMAAEFQVFDIERKSLSANNILEYIDYQLKNVFDDLLMYEDSIKSYKNIHNIDDIDEVRKQNMFSQLNIIENELVRVQIESNILQNILDELSRNDSPDAMYLLTVLSGSQYQSNLQADISKLGELVKKKEQLLQQVTENSSFVVSVNQQIEAQKTLMINMVRSIKVNTDMKLKELTKRYNSQYSQIYSNLSNPHFELKRIERSYSITEQFYNQLIEKKTEFSILLAGYVPENIILEKAYKAGEKVYPSKKKVLLIAIVLASFLSFVIIAFKYFRFDNIISVSEINKYTSVPVLGVLPKYASNIPIHQFIVEKYPKSILAESLRSVRSNLQFINNKPGPKIIGVTSTISGEGKTFLSVNLAGVLAISGKRVIIIDSDMRNPTVHKYFKLKNTAGLSSILSGQCAIEDTIQDIGKYNIKFITAGRIPPNPAELLNDEKFDLLIETLKKEFDYIIIDNPPIGLVSDSLKSMQLADYPIYVLMANYSKRNFLPLTEKMLKVYNIHNISIVLNGYDKSISNVDVEKDLVYAYGYIKGRRKGLGNNYYEEDVKPRYSFAKRIRLMIKRSLE